VREENGSEDEDNPLMRRGAMLKDSYLGCGRSTTTWNSDRDVQRLGNRSSMIRDMLMCDWPSTCYPLYHLQIVAVDMSKNYRLPWNALY